MHMFFSGIGGTAIGPLALIARQAGYEVSGSDKQDSHYISYLRKQGINDIVIGQTTESIQDIHTKKPIDWYVFSSAVIKENPNHPEITFCRQQGIKTSKRDEFIAKLLDDKQQRMVAVAGTHGKTTTTAMLVWLFKKLGLPVSYSVGAKIAFGEMGAFDPKATYFVYEADEYDRNFLFFHPKLSLITGIDWDHPDIYPTRQEYEQAFVQFAKQSERIIVWQSDLAKLKDLSSDTVTLADDASELSHITLPGHVNKRNAWQAVHALGRLTSNSHDELISLMNQFPGVSRRFEEIANRLYSDYAHTPEKIRGALQLGEETAGKPVVVVYEGLHNTRQHFIKEDLRHLFDGVKKLYVVPSYLAREDESLELLTPEKLIALLSQPGKAQPAMLDQKLQDAIDQHRRDGDTVLCLSAGGGGSLDEWLRNTYADIQEG